jgi:hypothetical protein
VSPPAAVDAYVLEVVTNLRGPLGMRRAIAEEVRDHLLESIADIDHDDAQNAALIATRRLGDPAVLARDVQPTLTRRHSRQASLALLLTACGLSLMWLWVFLTGPIEPWRERTEPRELAWTDVAGSTAMKVAVAAAILGILASWVIPRIATREDLASLAVRLGSVTSTVGFGLLSVAVAAIVGYAFLRGTVAPGSLEWSDVIAAATASIASVLVLGRRTFGGWSISVVT